MSRHLHMVVASSNGIVNNIISRLCSVNHPPNLIETTTRDILSFSYSPSMGMKVEPFPFEVNSDDKLVSQRNQLFKGIVDSLKEAEFFELRYDHSIGDDLFFLTVTYEPKRNLPNPTYR